MILCIPGVLSPEELRTVRALLSGCRFADGRVTAGWHARLVKNNEQADAGDAAVARAKKLATAALARNDVFRSGVLPRTIRPFLFSRYVEGMAFGPHVDDAIMGGKNAMRADVSLTLFISEPESYDGGELIIETTGGEQLVKLPGGSVVAYPSTTLHRVEAVTRGERMAGVTWIQSLVRQAENREILFDLDTVRRRLFQERGKNSDFDVLSKTYANLLRKWSEL